MGGTEADAAVVARSAGAALGNREYDVSSISPYGALSLVPGVTVLVSNRPSINVGPEIPWLCGSFEPRSTLWTIVYESDVAKVRLFGAR
jgi:hypothetical protein